MPSLKTQHVGCTDANAKNVAAKENHWIFKVFRNCELHAYHSKMGQPCSQTIQKASFLAFSPNSFFMYKT